jgi:hypothetical protein
MLNCCVFINMLSHNISHPLGELVTPGKQVKAAANWSSRLPWVPVRHGQWRVAVIASQVEHVSITGARADGLALESQAGSPPAACETSDS